MWTKNDEEQYYEEKCKNADNQFELERMRSRNRMLIALIGLFGSIIVAFIGTINVGQFNQPLACQIIDSPLINSIYNCGGIIEIAVSKTLTAIAPTLNVSTEQAPTNTPVLTITPSETIPLEVFVFDVYANQSWQPTDINVNRGDRIIIKYVEGCWSGGNNVTSCPENCGIYFECPDNYGSDIANGLDTWSCMPMNQNLTGYNAIIGRIGDSQPFVINKFYEHIVELSGELQVRMNDCDGWVFDNQGFVVISIERYES